MNVKEISKKHQKRERNFEKNTKFSKRHFKNVKEISKKLQNSPRNIFKNVKKFSKNHIF